MARSGRTWQARQAGDWLVVARVGVGGVGLVLGGGVGGEFNIPTEDYFILNIISKGSMF